MSRHGDTIVLDNGNSGLFMCLDAACHADQQISWERHGKTADPRCWIVVALPSEALTEALGIPPWHCWTRDAVVNDYGQLVIVGDALHRQGSSA